MTIKVGLSLPEGLVRRLDALIPETHATRSEAVGRAVELYLYRLACEHDAQVYERMPLTDAELTLADDAAVWSTAPPW